MELALEISSERHKESSRSHTNGLSFNSEVLRKRSFEVTRDKLTITLFKRAPGSVAQLVRAHP